MQRSLQIGPLTLVGEQAGTHVHVTVLGAGAVGSRPLCGRITVDVAEWYSLEILVELLGLSDGQHAADRREIVRLDGELAKVRAERDVLKQEARELRQMVEERQHG